MPNHASEQSTERASVVDALQAVFWGEAIPYFMVSFLYPIQFWILHAARFHERRWIRLVCGFLGVVLAIIVGVYGVEPLLDWLSLGSLKWPWKLVATILVTALFNLVAYIIVLLFDLPTLFDAKFRAAGKQSVSEWLVDILGHKLWSGANTYRLLEHLLAETQVLGRAKWLLVGFLSTDIDKKIQRDPDKKADSNGNLTDTDKPDHPLYKVTVHDWTVRTYSQFLADNMTHAKRTIHWVVDPIDLVTEIIPAHVIEVVISLGGVLRGDTDRIVRAANQALKDEPKTTNWGTLVDSYAPWCPRPRVATAGTSCQKNHTQCPESFPFSGEPHNRQLDYLWYAMFSRAVADLNGATATAKGIKMASGQEVGWRPVLSCYKKREEIVGSLVLPHIDEFRKAACSKKRHVYLGIKPSRLDDPTERIKKGVDNLRLCIASRNDYVRCISPRIADASQTENGLFSQLLCHQMNGAGSVTYQQPLGQDDIWASVDNGVKAKLLEWSIDLLSFTSDDAVKGVFVDDRPQSLGGDCHDIGFYDGLLVLSSGRGKTRDVTWRVYQQSPRLEVEYFPKEPSQHLVGFGELAQIVMEALK
ncbi:MAG: hypothetical protein ABSF26_09910 [Thermoguttaceae bacterium]